MAHRTGGEELSASGGSSHDSTRQRGAGEIASEAGSWRQSHVRVAGFGVRARESAPENTCRLKALWAMTAAYALTRWVNRPVLVLRSGLGSQVHAERDRERQTSIPARARGRQRRGRGALLQRRRERAVTDGPKSEVRRQACLRLKLDCRKVVRHRNDDALLRGSPRATSPGACSHAPPGGSGVERTSGARVSSVGCRRR